MLGDDATSNVQAKPASTHIRLMLAPDEWLEDAPQIGLGDARAVVADGDAGGCLVAGDSHLDRAIFH